MYRRKTTNAQIRKYILELKVDDKKAMYTQLARLKQPDVNAAQRKVIDNMNEQLLILTDQLKNVESSASWWKTEQSTSTLLSESSVFPIPK